MAERRKSKRYAASRLLVRCVTSLYNTIRPRRSHRRVLLEDSDSDSECKLKLSQSRDEFTNVIIKLLIFILINC